ncbi:MAG: hypothetical protein E7551_05265 [Ruminococcaceae bacterium]|nr:hypothetical protein [Oscillospiraceae bacterium]
MKRKILSLVLCLTLLITCCFTGSTVVSAEAAATENLIENGDFESYSGTTPTNWFVSGLGDSTAEIVEDVEIAEGVTANAWKLTNGTENERANLVYDGTIAIEKNAKYTTTFWVKVTNNKGFRAYMHETTYVALDGTTKSNKMAMEGQNIYSYYYLGKDSEGNPTTRVIRTDITHKWTVAETGARLDSQGESMFITRANNVEQVFTPDYPSTERQGEWLQVIHTFETGNKEEHEAEVAYQFAIPYAENGEVWIADVQMSVERFYVPSVNDDTLGTIAEGTKVPVTLGEEFTLTAAPFGENNFLGWYVGDTLVSEDTSINVVYNGSDTPQYTAHFEQGATNVLTFEEGYENGQSIARATDITGTAADTEAGYTEFANTEVSGSGFVVDSSHTGNWRRAEISNAYAQSGSYSLKYFGAYGYVGYKYTGLEKNTNYVLSVYGYLTYRAGSTDWAGVSDVIVTPATSSCRSTSNRLYKKYSRDEWANIVNDWTKIEVTVNTGDNTDIILWIDSCGADAALYLDNYSIASEPISYTPNVNDNTLGYVNTVKTREGARTTVKAGTYGEATFDGWYNGEVLLSKDEKYTFTYSSEAANYEARFIGTGFGIDGGFENFASGTTLAQLQHVTGTVGSASSDWTPELWLQSSLDGNNEYFMESNNSGDYRKIQVINTYAHTGKNSIRFTGYYGFMGRKFSNLEANTDYIITFYALIKNSDTGKVGGYRITPSDVGVTLPTGSTIAAADCIASGENKWGTKDVWEKATITFNSGDNTEVILWINQPDTAEAYLDDFAITRTASFTVEESAYGTTDAVNGKSYGYNEKVTVTATPYDSNTFAGWYVGDELVSTDATYTVYAQNGLVLTPVFEGEVYNHLVAQGQDGTFENGSVEGVYFADKEYDCSWCSAEVSSSYAYEGSNSLKVNGRHRNTIIPLTGLEKNSNYTLSFYFFLNEIEAPVEGVEGNEIKTAKISTAITPATVESLVEEKITDIQYIQSEAKWQKVEFSFNTGSNTDVNLVLRIQNEIANNLTYIDNLTLMCTGYERLFTPGNIDNDEDNNVNLNDLITLAQYVAQWEGVEVNEAALDVNGDGAVTLEDVTHFAQYLAGWNVTLSNAEYVPTVPAEPEPAPVG